MKYQIFSENQWIYPDTQIDDINGKRSPDLHAPRGSDVCFQILTDLPLDGGESITYSLNIPNCSMVLYQLLPGHVGRNSAPTTYTTDNYDSVKHFVTRQAPFDVYEVTMPLDSGILEKGRCALFARLNVQFNAVPGEYSEILTVKVADTSIEIPVNLKVYQTSVPSLENANFHMVNWIYYDLLASQHGVEVYSDEYFDILREYLLNQLGHGYKTLDFYKTVSRL